MKIWKRVLSAGLILGGLIFLLLPSMLNYQLPHVETQRLKERKIVRTVMVHAKVKPLDVIRFSFDQPVVVAEYFVKKGRNVGRNIPLFRLSKEAGLPQDVNEQAIAWEQRKNEILLQLDRLDAAKAQENLQLSELQTQVDQAERDLKEVQNLFELGMVAKQDLDQARRFLEASRRSFSLMAEEQQMSKEGVRVQRESLESELTEIAHELDIVDSLVSGFYLDEEGNAYSEHSGFILNKNAENERISTGSPVLEMAMIDDFRRLEMIGTISVEDLDYIDIGMPIQIDTDTENRPFHLEVTDISNLVENDMVELTMKMTAEPEGKFSIGTNYTGRIERVLSEESTFAIPISAIVDEDFGQDAMVNVYYLEEDTEGIFDRYYVRELRARTKFIGDREVLVQIDQKDLDLAAIEIITNPGYKIYKDARVLP